MHSRSQLTRAGGLGAILIAAAITPCVGPAKAEDPGPLFCGGYAQQAALAAQINKDNGCYDDTDPRNPGSLNADDHYNYCMSGDVSLFSLKYDLARLQTLAKNCSFCSGSEFATKSTDRLLANKM